MPNRPTSNKNSSRRRRRQRQLDQPYQVLEPRQLLAVDFELNFSGTLFPTDSTALVPDVSSEITEDHIVEVANGRFLVHNRFTGTRVMSKSLDQFFDDAGSIIFTTAESPRVVFDDLSQRYIVAARGTGLGNWIHVAFSNTSDPTGEWQSLQFVADSTATRFNSDLTMAVDADAVYLTTNNYTAAQPDEIDNVSIYSIPKADMFLSNPTLTNMTRFEGLDPAVFGTTIQVASNFEASDGRAVAIGSLDVANKTMIDILGSDAAGATLDGPFMFNVDFGLTEPTHDPEIPHDSAGGGGEEFSEPPALIGQDSGNLLIVKHGFTGAIEERDGSIFAVQTISLDTEEGEEPTSSSINWFQLDVANRAVAGSTPIDPLEELENNTYQQTRDDNDLDPFAVALRGPVSHVLNPENGTFLFNPAIAVSSEGYVAITYNRVGGEDISTGVAVGTTVNGINRRNIQLEDDLLVQEGFADYNLNTTENDPWGFRGSVQVDPLQPNRFLISQPWANTTSRWTIQNSLIELVDMNPIIEADDADNTIVVRRADDPAYVEIEIDGEVTDTFLYDAVGRVEVWAQGGDDTFLIDYSNGDPVPSGGFVLDGAEGTDTIETNSPTGSTFDIGLPVFDIPFGSTYPDYLGTYQVRFGNGGGTDGFYNELSELVDFEEVLGGPGNDTFNFRDNHSLDGSANGQEGDDTFNFIDTPLDPLPFRPIHSGVNKNIIGGPGYDTLNFTQRENRVALEILSTNEEGGFNGRQVATEFEEEWGQPEQLAIGGFEHEEEDSFGGIENLVGSELFVDDSLTMLPANPGTWVIDDEFSSYTVEDKAGRDQTLDFFEWNLLTASTSDDLVYIRSNSVAPLVFDALDGSDEFTFSSTAPRLDGHVEDHSLMTLNAGTGRNVIRASNLGGQSDVSPLILQNRVIGLADFVYTIEGDGTIDMELWGSPFDDFFRLHSFQNQNTLIVRSDAGNDEFDIQDLSKAQIEVHGGRGDDTYFVEQVQDIGDRNLSLFDSLDDESDSLFIAGTSADERFIITTTLFDDLNFAFEGIENLGVDGKRGDDIFEILDYASDIIIRGGGDDDIFYLSSDGESFEGDLSGFVGANLTIDGGEGNNQLKISNALDTETGLEIVVREDRIEGLWDGELHFMSTNGGVFRSADGFDGIHIRGSNGGLDLFDGVALHADDSLTFEGLAGNDTFFARANVLGNVRFLGGEDNDTHNVVFGDAENRMVQIEDDGTAINRASFFGSSNDDTIAVLPTGVQFATQMATVSGNFQTLSVLARGGNDELSVAGNLANITRFFGEDGDDQFHAMGTDGMRSLRVLMGEGNDQVHLNEITENTFSIVQGENGDDLIAIGEGAKGTVIADGQAGSDTYEVQFALDTGRFVKAVDSGTAEMDALNITATEENDEFLVGGTRVNFLASDENVVFSAETETLNLNTGIGNDVVNVFGSSAGATNIVTGIGADEVHINSTTGADILTVDSGDGNDTLGIYSVTANTNLDIDAGNDDDSFIVGSSQTNDNGNLGVIRGQISLFGGSNSAAGQDSVYINDRRPSAPYAYLLTDSGLESIPGPRNISRPTFQGIQYSSMEFVRLDTTNLGNYIQVEGSSRTGFHIDGNDPADGTQIDTIELLDLPSSDGRQLHITDPDKGEGFWEFADNTLDIVFENIEQTIDGT